MRTRNPEKTVEKILSVSQELFLKQGYDETTMQDIMNHGLSKGAIYHHFKSKKDIFEHIMQKIEASNMDSFNFDTNNTSLYQLKELLISKLIDKDRINLLKNAETLFNDPKVFGELYKINMNQTTDIIEKYINNGNTDGSMICEMPKETSELITYFFSIWIGTSLYNISKTTFLNKLEYYTELFKFSGIDLIDLVVREKIINYYTEMVEAD